MKADLDRMIEFLREAAVGDLGRESGHWLEKLEEAYTKRSRFQHAYAEGVMSLDDLRGHLVDLKDLEETARRELRNLQGTQERIAQLERNRDALLEDYASRSPEALASLTSEQRHHLYKLLRLRLVANEDGTAALDADALPNLTCSKVENLWSRSTCTRSTC